MNPPDYRLTQFSHGSGCGCKIAPHVLEEILGGLPSEHFPQLLVGNQSRDDAAVYDLGEGLSLISTTDFFTPIVDDPMDFGRIAAANALSDVYAMGGEPLMAIAILGWPVDRLPAAMARKVLEGGQEICQEAGIPLAGGHSVDIPEPIFGLAVTGKVRTDQIKRNQGGKASDLLYLTKPLGVGILSTALKRGILREEDVGKASQVMLQLNKAGTAFASLPYVHAMTDVTGFGLAGHLLELCRGGEVEAVVEFDQLPLLAGLEHYVQQNCYPDNVHRNFQSFNSQVEGLADMFRYVVMCDPQTSGGLLMAVDPGQASHFEQCAHEQGLAVSQIGALRNGPTPKILVQ